MKSPLRYLIEGRTAGAVATATLLLSSLAQAGRCDAPPPVVPEANAALVLLPVVGAVLFFWHAGFGAPRPRSGPATKGRLSASEPQRAQHELDA
jgi:hypothetical protein